MNKIVLLAILCVSFFAQAQVEKRIPFVFLNQYFSYDLLSADRIVISDKVINFSDFVIDPSKKAVTIDLLKLSKWQFSAYTMVLKRADQTLLGKLELRVAQASSTPSKKYGIPAGTGAVCIVSANNFSRIEICKTLAGSDKQVKEVRIDGQVVENKSIVVLKDNLKSILFEANLSSENSVKLVTKKRMFYPRSITKEAAQPVLQVRFIENGYPLNQGWNDQVDVNQSAISVPKDSILKLEQDLYFTNSAIQSLAVDYAAPEAPVKQVAKPKPVKKPDVYIDPRYQYIIEPFTVFAGLKGSGSTIEANLASDLGKGLRFSYRRKLEQGNELQAYFSAYQMNISSDVNQTAINNAAQMLMGAGVGWKHMLTRSIGIIPQIELQQDVFFKNLIGSAQIDIVNGLNKQASANPFWIFYSDKLSLATLDAGLTYILPTSAGGQIVKSGYKYKVGATYQYRFPEGALIFNIQSGQRKQNFEDISYSENFLIMGAGYSFYFK
ncbi:MAG: hypothetical protein H7256_12235 [Bdellovibrio sp.]|nr:hypothetical protein [Bdellovibrio sp.]